MYYLLPGEDLRFPRRGHQPLVWDTNILFGIIVAENCMKMKKNGPGTCVPRTPLTNWIRQSILLPSAKFLPPGSHPLWRYAPAPETDTAAGSTHSTGMHSCYLE